MWADGGGYAERPGVHAPGRPACPPPQAVGQGRRCPRHGPGPDARRDGPRRRHRHAGHATAGPGRKPRSGPDARTDGPRHTRRHAGHTPRPGPGGNPAQALTRGQTALGAHADTLDTRHGRARAEAPQGRSAVKSRSRRAEPRGGQPRRRHHAGVRTPLFCPPSCGGPARELRPRRRGGARPPADSRPHRCRGCRTLAVEDSVFVRPPAGAVVGPPRLTRSPGRLPRPARACAFRRPRQHAAAAPGVLRRIGQTRVPEGHLPFRDAGESAGPWPAPAGVRLSSPGPPAAGSCRGPNGVCGRRPGGPPPADRR